LILEIERRASKNLKKIYRPEKLKIEAVLEELEYVESFKEVKIEKLKGYKDRYKIRVGNYRIVIKKLANTHIQITSIANRKDIYNKLFGLTAL